MRLGDVVNVTALPLTAVGSDDIAPVTEGAPLVDAIPSARRSGSSSEASCQGPSTRRAGCASVSRRNAECDTRPSGCPTA